MKVKYEFEINKKEYHKVLCEGCPMLNEGGTFTECYCSGEYVKHQLGVCGSYYYDKLSYLESKCPLEVVE